MKKTLCLLLALMMLLCASCSEEVVKNDPNQFMVVTSFYPVYVAAANIIDGAENVELVNLTSAETGCIHDYMLTTEDMKLLSTADLFIASGMGMEAFMEKSSLGIPQLEILDCGEDVSRELGDEETFNPHYWMNIQNAIDQCEKIKKTLCRLNPENSEVYEKNTEEYVKKLSELIPEVTERAAGLQKKEMVVFHESFDYFADQFGLSVVSVLSNHDGSAASPKKVAEVIDYMKKNDIKAVFAEKGAEENETLKTVRNETGCKVYTIDTLTYGSISEKTKDAYIKAVKSNISTLEKALGH